MVSLARERLKSGPERARVYQSDGTPRADEPDRTFDRFVSTYVLDLLAPDCIERRFDPSACPLHPEQSLWRCPLDEAA